MHANALLVLQFHLDLQQISWCLLVQLKLSSHGKLHYLLENYSVRTIFFTLCLVYYNILVKEFSGRTFLPNPATFILQKYFIFSCHNIIDVIIISGK